MKNRKKVKLGLNNRFQDLLKASFANLQSYCQISFPGVFAYLPNPEKHPELNLIILKANDIIFIVHRHDIIELRSGPPT